MADYYRIETSNQAVAGTAAGEMFEFVPYGNSLTNVTINAAGGNDTIKVSASSNQTISAMIMNLDPSSVLDLGGYSYYYTTEADGLRITDSSSRLNLKLWGTTNTAIFSNSNNSFTSLDQYSTANGQHIRGTQMNDNIVVNHSDCTGYGNDGDDIITVRGNGNSLAGNAGSDTIIATGDNNTLYGCGRNSYDYSDDVLIVGGSNNSVQGAYGNDTFEIYSYSAGGSNNTLTGNNSYDTYIISTGLVGVDGTQIATAAYNPYTTETVNVTITDAISGDSYYLRDWGNFGINASTTSDGVVISSTTGRINITMAGQRNWSAVKDNLITLDNAQGLVGTYTLEQAVALASQPPTPPTGVYVSGEYLNVSAGFVGNLIMSSAAANYTNNQIVTIDATGNYQVGMQLGGNSNSNAIFAGQGGNILWGGEDTAADYLFGGAGTDIFRVGKYDGNDAVYNSDSGDVIHLYDVTVDDIISYAYDANTIALGLSSGNVISVVNGDAVSPMFVLSNGEAYRFNRSSYSWQNA